MGTGTTRALRTAGVLLSAAALTATLVPSSNAGDKTWHILSPERVEQARLTSTVFRKIDPAITSVDFRKGGQGNIEVCGFERSQRISASRQSRWSTTTSRTGRTLILQFKKVRMGKNAFGQLKQTYSACTPASFAKPERTTVNYRFLTKKKQIRLVWALYTTDAKTEIQRAEGLSIKRAGGALIVTRTIVKGGTTVKPLKMKKSVKLTSRQFSKYKNAAFY